MYTFLDWYYNLVECCLSMIYFYCYHPYTGTERGVPLGFNHIIFLLCLGKCSCLLHMQMAGWR